MSFIVVYLIKFIFINWTFSIAIALMIFIGVALNIIVQEKYSLSAEIEASRMEAERNKLFEDVVSNIKTVQKMNAVGFINGISSDIYGECMRTSKIAAIKEEIAFIINKSFGYLSNPAVFILMYLFRDKMSFTTFQLALIGQVLTKVPYNVRAVSRVFTKYTKLKGTLTRLEDICSDENIRKDIYCGNIETIDIRDVSYSYVDELSKSTVVINVPEFNLSKGDFVCITGESGQGKTTLLDILSGQIETDKVVINDTFNDKRPDCVFISQDTEIFDMSLRDNLLLGRGENSIDENKILYYLKCVGLGEWLNMQPDGLDTMLGERGVFVSTGQRQRLNLIRGLLDDTKQIYLLDEPTSNVDEETEELMVSLIKRVLHDKTVICVTHRPKILELATKRYKFENSILKPF